MDSPQSVVSPFNGSSVFAGPEKQKVDSFVHNPGFTSRRIEVQNKDSEGIIGVLEVYIHQARDIHNICIYHKQDVYAKICLTSDPEKTVSTQTVNGGGKNPVFNEKLRIDVRTIDSSLKCEIWMLSRVKNYLEDQLLGFALVPLSEVLMNNWKLEKEFSLSSTDLFHSPAGFVQLSLTYTGSSPDVMALPSPPASGNVVQDSKVLESPPCEFDKIEFPDPKVANENQQMVSEYFALPNTNLDSQRSQDFVSPDTENQLSADGGHVLESFSTRSIESMQLPKHDSPPNSVSTTNGFPLASLPANSPGDSESPNQESVSTPKENLMAKREEGGDSESNASDGVHVDMFAKPVLTVNIEPEPKVVQQDIVDMYMKSMQQFTESLAKMKLPMDVESGPSTENSSSDLKSPASKENGSRVFYGSRAFF